MDTGGRRYGVAAAAFRHDDVGPRHRRRAPAPTGQSDNLPAPTTKTCMKLDPHWKFDPQWLPVLEHFQDE